MIKDVAHGEEVIASPEAVITLLGLAMDPCVTTDLIADILDELEGART